MKDGRINSSPLRNEMGWAIPAHYEMKHSIGSGIQATEKYQLAKSNHEMKNRRMNSSPIQMCCASRLGYRRFLPCLAAAFELEIQIQCCSWNTKDSVVEHIISSNYFAHHIIQPRKFHEMKIGGWIPAQFKCVGPLGWDISGSYPVLQLISSLASRSTAQAIPEM